MDRERREIGAGYGIADFKQGRGARLRFAERPGGYGVIDQRIVEPLGDFVAEGGDILDGGVEQAGIVVGGPDERVGDVASREIHGMQDAVRADQTAVFRFVVKNQGVIGKENGEGSWIGLQLAQGFL